jgi:hypothetical protein
MFCDLSKYNTFIPREAPKSLEHLSLNLRMYADETIEIWYSPMGSRTVGAKLWILGITPGWNQMRIAYEEAAKWLNEGFTNEQAAQKKKPRVAFAGSMRTNLVAMLDDLEVASLLGQQSSAELFDSNQLRTGSVLKYPVFKNFKNYTGHSPKPTNHPALKEMIDTVFAQELADNTDCLIVPLGKAVEDVLTYSAEQGRLDMARVLKGFPHPSGANGHKKKQYAAMKSQLREQIERWF